MNTQETYTLAPEIEPAPPEIPDAPASRRVCLRYQYIEQPHGRLDVLWGNAARLPDGRVVARHENLGGTGTAWSEIDPTKVDWAFDPTQKVQRPDGSVGYRLEGFDHTNIIAIMDQAGEVRRMKTRVREWWRLAPETDPAADEFKRFQAAWPHVAAELGIMVEPAASTMMFATGVVEYPKPVGAERGWTGGAPWRECLRRHVHGDYGDHGQHNPTPLSDGEIWAIGLQPIGRQNDAAIAAGNGMVRSKYAIDVAGAPRTRITPGHFLEVVTILGRENATYMHVVSLP